MKKILITGASGFVGSHLVEEALQRNLEVYAGIRKTSSREFLQDSRINFIELNFGDKDQMANLLKRKQFDYIIHNAGVVTAPKLADYWLVNRDYVKNFADAVIASGEMPEKFTFISSAAAYGPASEEDLTDFLKEEDVPNPINTYGKSKLEAERYLAQLPDFPYITIRPTGVYGPREKEIFVFFKLVNRNIEGYIGTRKQHLAFVYVKDLARVVLDATTSSFSQKSYFVSDGRYYAQWDLGKAAKRILNKKTLRFHVPIGLVRGVAWFMEQIGKGDGKYPTLNLEKVRILESVNWKCDIEPLKEDLNFQPQYDLEEGLEETLAWYRENGWL
ncbi:MAG: NAD(P)-dependent oxidoreductase [Lewinellaceae bacterium]|nr:NAD(P)-dependent oxidoreductase [Saprospiraceae bacterium]MCB9337046.1 NAD(P)-dependent oxidoreductase [Lewinellaceae bacterium]